ncbi:hypothetical protein CEXT_512141, partial [Caerostris extrusa]
MFLADIACYSAVTQALKSNKLATTQKQLLPDYSQPFQQNTVQQPLKYHKLPHSGGLVGLMRRYLED